MGDGDLPSEQEIVAMQVLPNPVQAALTLVAGGGWWAVHDEFGVCAVRAEDYGEPPSPGLTWVPESAAAVVSIAMKATGAGSGQVSAGAGAWVAHIDGKDSGCVFALGRSRRLAAFALVAKVYEMKTRKRPEKPKRKLSAKAEDVRRSLP